MTCTQYLAIIPARNISNFSKYFGQFWKNPRGIIAKYHYKSCYYLYLYQFQYHPTSGLMLILHFDWLRYYRSMRNKHRVAKFAGFVNIFILFYSQINIFFFAEFIIAFFCPTSWVILKKLDPSGYLHRKPGFFLQF